MKPYRDEVTKGEKKLSQFKSKLKSIKEKIKKAKTDKLESDRKLLLVQIEELESSIRTNGQRADSIYYEAYDLDIKNPFKALKSSSDLLGLLHESFFRSSELVKILQKELS